MYVSNIMSKDVVTLSLESDLNDAARLMKEYDIRHLPVVESGKLVGLVTERDVRGALFPNMLERISISDLMTASPVTIRPDAMLEDAARLIYRRKIGCLPVVDDQHRLVGIVTVADMLAALIELMGFISSSSRLDVLLPENGDDLERVLRVIQQNGGRIMGVSVTRTRKDKSVHLFRLQKTDLKPIVEQLTLAGYTVVSSLS